MMRSRLLIALLCSFFLWLDLPALAFRCGTDLVREGDSQEEVLRKCGEPTEVESWHERWPTGYTGYQRYSGSPPPHYDYPGNLVEVELWTYNLGSTKFIRYLRFQDGVLVRITKGDKTY